MALKATIYKAEIQIADMERHYYADHSHTIARHPSETDERLMARILAFILYAHEDLTFTKGLFDLEEADLWQKDLTGAIELWMDIGQPDDVRIKKASNRAKKVVVLSYASSTNVWWSQIEKKIERFDNVKVLQLSSEISEQLTKMASRNMRLQANLQDGHLWLSDENASLEITVETLKMWK
jgi:uncharacterized protein YaeQ